MEQRLAWDFSDVRVHDDRSAWDSARTLGARAWTMGTNIAFDQGEFSTSTTNGRALLAHELVHVVQQQRPGHSAGRDTAEAEASRAAHRVATGESFAVETSHQPRAPLLEPSKKSRAIDPAATFVPDGNRDIVKIRGIRKYLYITTIDGSPLLRKGATSAGPLVESTRGGRAFSYSIYAKYDNIQSNLTVVPGPDYSTVHSSVFPSVQFNVTVVGKPTPPKPKPPVKKPPGVLVASRVEGHSLSDVEQAGQGAAGPEVAAALAYYRNTTVGQALDAAAGDSAQVWKGETQRNLPLIDAIRYVYYVTPSRIYVMDRSGFVLDHVDPKANLGQQLLQKVIPGPQELATFKRGSVSLPPGAYFMGGMIQGTRRSATAQHFAPPLAVSTDGVKMGSGEVSVQGVRKGAGPLMAQFADARKTKGGIAIVVSKSMAGNKPMKRNWHNVRLALQQAVPLLPLAFAREWARVRADIVGELSDLVLDEGIDFVVEKAGGPVAQVLLQGWSVSMKALQGSELLNVALYAQNETEIGIAAQGFARMAVQQAIQSTVSRLRSGGKKALDKARSSRSGGPKQSAPAQPAAPPKTAPKASPKSDTPTKSAPAKPAATPKAPAAPAPATARARTQSSPRMKPSAPTKTPAPAKTPRVAPPSAADKSTTAPQRRKTDDAGHSLEIPDDMIPGTAAYEAKNGAPKTKAGGEPELVQVPAGGSPRPSGPRPSRSGSQPAPGGAPSRHPKTSKAADGKTAPKSDADRVMDMVDPPEVVKARRELDEMLEWLGGNADFDAKPHQSPTPTKAAPSKSAPSKSAPSKSAPSKSAPSKSAPSKSTPSRSAGAAGPAPRVRPAPVGTSSAKAPSTPPRVTPTRRPATAAKPSKADPHPQRT
ncbi:MAG: DUF4157 domain-containing protein, partial [Deltaproteobacteria bacterium]|nr:DUF4157 domain-containing protein [Deltaproteobacteria bacterium]